MRLLILGPILIRAAYDLPITGACSLEQAGRTIVTFPERLVRVQFSAAETAGRPVVFE